MGIFNKSRDHFAVITYPEAVHERVITKKSLERNTIEIRIGEKYTIDFLMEFFDENAFQRTDFVYEPGQFAIRGGIVDVYSFAHEMPYRVEFYGDRVSKFNSYSRENF